VTGQGQELVGSCLGGLGGQTPSELASEKNAIGVKKENSAELQKAQKKVPTPDAKKRRKWPKRKNGTSPGGSLRRGGRPMGNP